MQIMNSIIVFLLICLVHLGLSDDSILSSEFYTNYFTDNDFGSWSVTGTNIPADHLFSQCGSERIFGGYQKFTGNKNGPTKISRQYFGLIAHYAVHIQAKIYKIDSYNNENIFIMVDNVAQKIYNFQQTNSTQNICGDPYPVIDTINKNFNDSVILVDFIASHNSSALNISIETDLKSNKGWWGVRQISIMLLQCDKSCLTCTNASACTSCDTSIAGLALIGAYCECTVLATIKQLITQCTAMPCLLCVTSCSPGYYYSGITTQCEPCNVACSTCSGPMNTVFPLCGSCANGFFRNNPLTDPCYSCPGYCNTCSALSTNACTSCKQGYFLFGTQCLPSCPNGTYSEQTTRQCFPCSVSCSTCNGVTGFYCTSCTGSLYLSLTTNQCLPSCPPPYFKHNNKCLQQCPLGTFEDFTFYVCISCLPNCNQCTNSTSCSMCAGDYFLLNGQCITSCPTNYYVSQTSGQCVRCHLDCLECFGGTQTSCIVCSDATKIILNGTCYAACPNGTFSATCQPCHSLCLECTGPLETDCTSCSSPNFLQLSSNRCVSVCQLGTIVDKVNFTCKQCPSKMVGYFLQCVPCSQTCQTCYGTSCLQCLTCDQNSTFYISTCLRNSTGSNKIIKSNARSIGVSNKLLSLLILTSIIFLALEIFFTYKTPILTVIEFIQILGYMYFYSGDISQQVQRILSYFYYVNFSSILTINVQRGNDYLPAKISLIGKSGYYAVDTLLAHVLMIMAVIITVMMKKGRSLSRVISFCYDKLNPYLISYLYRLLILDQSFSTILYLRYGNISTPLGIASLVILLLDVVLLGFSLLWKVKPIQDEDRRQYGLFYFNQIKHDQINDMVNQEEGNDNVNVQKKSFNLLTLLFYVGKVPFPLAMVYFVTNGTYQCIAMLGYSLFFMLMIIILPYKRRIYRTLCIVGSIVVVLSSGLFLAVYRNPNNSVALEIIWLLYAIFVFIVTIIQLVINYKYFFHIIKYSIKNVFNFINQEEESHSISSGTVNIHYNERSDHKYSIETISRPQNYIQSKQLIIDVPNKQEKSQIFITQKQEVISQSINQQIMKIKKQQKYQQQQQVMNQQYNEDKFQQKISKSSGESQQARQRIKKEASVNQSKTINLNNNSLSTILKRKKSTSEREQTEVDLDFYL